LANRRVIKFGGADLATGEKIRRAAEMVLDSNSKETVVVVSAMKMESEYKAGKDGIIKQVHVNEGDTIEGHQALITLE